MHFNSPLITIFSGLITGSIAAYMAYQRGKNIYLWFTVGFFFGILGLFVILFFNQKKKLPQEKLQPVPSVPDLKGPKDKLWYYVDELRNPTGPFSHHYLNSLWKTGKIRETTYIWNEEMSDWKKLEQFIK